MRADSGRSEFRPIIISGAALVALLGAAAALAAGNFNSYQATLTFCKSTPSFTSTSCAPSAPGTRRHPVAEAVHEIWTIRGNNGHNAAPYTRSVAREYGITTDAKDFPVCTAKMINNAGYSRGWTKVCPDGSQIGSGSLNVLLVPYNHATVSNPTQCNPWLTAWNGGVQKGRQVQVFFIEEYPQAPGRQYTCIGGAIHTGATAAYNGYITLPSSANRNTWSIDTAQPPQDSTSAGGVHGLYASLVKLKLVYLRLTRKKDGHTVAYMESIGCVNGKRPYSFTFYAQNYQGQSPPHQTTTISHTATCG
jgi:hypothetical protein